MVIDIDDDDDADDDDDDDDTNYSNNNLKKNKNIIISLVMVIVIKINHIIMMMMVVVVMTMLLLLMSTISNWSNWCQKSNPKYWDLPANAAWSAWSKPLAEQPSLAYSLLAETTRFCIVYKYIYIYFQINQNGSKSATSRQTLSLVT